MLNRSLRPRGEWLAGALPAAALFLIAGLAVLCPRAAQAQESGGLKLTAMSIKASADMADVTISYAFDASNRSANAALQIYAHRDDITDQDKWETINPSNPDGQPLILHIYRGLVAKGSFTVKLPRGKYGACRLLLFGSPDGKSIDFRDVLYDSSNDPARSHLNLDLTVSSSNSRILKPTLVAGIPEVVSRGIDRYEVIIPATVKVPAQYAGSDTGFWAMAKSAAGFSQVFAPLKEAHASSDPADPYKLIPITFRINNLSAGVSTFDYGLFHESWGDPIQWDWHAADIEAGGGSWVQPAPQDFLPPRLRVIGGRFVTTSGALYDFYAKSPAAQAVSFVRGGDYGNAICWDTFPQLDTPGYFVLLRDMGCRFIRFNFNPDRYAGEPLYQHAVDQVVQNILSAGLYPIISPQDLPAADTVSLRVIRGLAVVRAMARKYAGQSVWLEICNEPKEFATWEEWKPVAEQYVREIRQIDPDALVIVPFEAYSKDGRGAARDPITSTPVDLYDGHAYLDPADIQTNFKPAIDAGLPLIIGEYGGDTPEYLHAVDRALQSLHGLLAAAPWAFTIPGQDSLPLIKDGSTAQLVYTPAGEAIAHDYARWDAGRTL